MGLHVKKPLKTQDMRFNLIITLIFFCYILSAQSTYEVKLNVICTSDEVFKVISPKIGKSKFPPLPVTDTLFFIDSLQIKGYQYFDYEYRLSYGKDSSNPGNKGGFRLFIKSANDIKLVVDTDLDKRLEDEVAVDVRNSKATFSITINNNVIIEYEFYIWNINLVYSYDFGGVALKQLNYFTGICKLNGEQENIIIEDEALGVSIHMNNMLIGNDTLTHVMLNEPFLYGNTYYSFSDFDISDLSIKLESKPAGFNPEGYRKGYFVNKEILQHELGTNLNDKPALLYFWGIWCKPCVSNFDKNLKLYQQIKDENSANMFFCSYNQHEDHVQQCKDFVGKSVDVSDQVFMLEEDVKTEMSDFVKYDSLVSLLKIDTYPTYILIDKDGKILFRGNEVTNELLTLLKQ